MRKILIPLATLLLASLCFSQEVISWKDAAKYYGQTKTVEGTVVVTRNTGKVCFLNFSEKWKTDFTAVIFASDFPKFPPNPETYYKGKKVQVTGKVQDYQGKPEIILKNSSQIRVSAAEGPVRLPLTFAARHFARKRRGSIQAQFSIALSRAWISRQV